MYGTWPHSWERACRSSKFATRAKQPISPCWCTRRRFGKALAAALGAHPAVLIRGHGAAVVGSSLGQAVSRSVYLQKNAIIQAQAMALGQNINYLNADEAHFMADNAYDRDWEIWKRQSAVR